MTSVQHYCHRAMLLEGGALRYIGDPEEAGRRYLRMNFSKRQVIAGREIDVVADFLARVIDAWLENDRGERIENLEVGEPIRLKAILEARQDLADPAFALHVNNADGVEVFTLRASDEGTAEGIRISRGSRTTISAAIENPLLPGRYEIVCWIGLLRSEQEAAQQPISLLEFVVFGVDEGQGIVSVPGEIDVVIEEAGASEGRS
jgi:ABC-2 type transport system ATP-binding protein